MMKPNPPRLFLSPPHLGEAELRFVHEAFASNYIAPLGPMVDAFEREFADFTGVPHCLALSSGTAAMYLALRELGSRPRSRGSGAYTTPYRRCMGDVSDTSRTGVAAAAVSSWGVLVLNVLPQQAVTGRVAALVRRPAE